MLRVEFYDDFPAFFVPSRFIWESTKQVFGDSENEKRKEFSKEVPVPPDDWKLSFV